MYLDISAEDHIRMQSTFQKHCDNAISKTFNYENSATHADILAGYIAAWKGGCKGCTVYRNGSRVLQVRLFCCGELESRYANQQ